ncbi:hypothetical protein DFH06DRAFT_1159497 [Mycena polygramma]|nr:hypothetical protein DFH06DRAFT_1159497 [Mycena polygramma]
MESYFAPWPPKILYLKSEGDPWNVVCVNPGRAGYKTAAKSACPTCLAQTWEMVRRGASSCLSANAIPPLAAFTTLNSARKVSAGRGELPATYRRSFCLPRAFKCCGAQKCVCSRSPMGPNATHEGVALVANSVAWRCGDGLIMQPHARAFSCYNRRAGAASHGADLVVAAPDPKHGDGVRKLSRVLSSHD